MMLRSLLLLLVLLLVGGVWVASGLLRPPPATGAQALLGDLIGSPTDLAGFARATEPGSLSFPEAFGAHPDYRTEWWYYTGNVETAEGRPFGYQLTFFRRALRAEVPDRASVFAARDIYMAHFALTDGAAGVFYADERFQRGSGGLAGAEAAPYQVWLDDWVVREVAPGSYAMEAETDEVAIHFTLTDQKGPILQGDRGLSQKSSTPGNASYYYSQTRLETSGWLRVGTQRYDVAGLSWKDHEYSTAALEEGTDGWDWFSLHLSDGREIMYYQLRGSDGSILPATSGSLIREDGSVLPLSGETVRLTATGAGWQSPATGGSYPLTWKMEIPSEEITLTIEPLIPNQELRLSVTYWEGAIRATGQARGQPLTARGYLELTGYAGAAVPIH